MCPNCKEPMVAFEHEGIEIDRCVECGGTWLDAGELEMISELAGVGSGPLSEALGRSTMGKAGSRRCPRCNRKLHPIMVGSRPAADSQAPPGSPPAVELDCCPRGHGIWFDRDELRTVIARFDEGEGGAVARFFDELFREDLTSNPEGG